MKFLIVIMSSYLLWLPASMAADDVSVDYFIQSGSSGSISFRQQDNARILIAFDGVNLETIYRGQEAKILTNPDVLARLGGISIKVEDYNYDGFLDLAISSAIGYGGLNVLYDIHVFLPIDERFSNAIAQICDPKIVIDLQAITDDHCKLSEKYLFQIVGSKLSQSLISE